MPPVGGRDLRSARRFDYHLPMPSSPLQRRIDAVRDGRSIRQDRVQALKDFLPQQFERDHRKPFDRLGEFIEKWAEIMPPEIVERSRLSAINRGVLTIHLDGSSTLYAADRLLKSGLESQLRLAGRKAMLRRVRLEIDASLAPEPPAQAEQNRDY